MNLPKFNVLLASTEEGVAPLEHEVTILHGDQLRAELEAPKHGLNDMAAAPMHFTTLWVWAALIRTKAIDSTVKFQEFKPRLLALEAADDDASDEVGPTQPEAATS